MWWRWCSSNSGIIIWKVVMFDGMIIAKILVLEFDFMEFKFWIWCLKIQSYFLKKPNKRKKKLITHKFQLWVKFYLKILYLNFIPMKEIRLDLYRKASILKTNIDKRIWWCNWSQEWSWSANTCQENGKYLKSQ